MEAAVANMSPERLAGEAQVHGKLKRTAQEEHEDAPEAKRLEEDREHETVGPVGGFTYAEKLPALEEKSGIIEYRVVNNDFSRPNTIILTGLKNIFQKQLPEMPKPYVARLVYDLNHTSMAIVGRPLQVIGGICFREFRARGFAEIVFCAIASDHQIKGYGSHLMARFKDYVRARSGLMHLLTYADNSAIGYFQKQGFTKDIALEARFWKGYIKDYDGGTLMHCSLLPRIRYVEVGRMLAKQKQNVLDKIRVQSRSHVVHRPPELWASGNIVPIDPLSIPAIKASGWTPEMDALSQAAPRRGPFFTEFRNFLVQIQNHKQAWPFQQPVDGDVVPDYYTVITSPMDLSTVEQKLERDTYVQPKDLIDDLTLMLENCKQYNMKTSVYYKCAVKVEKFMWALVRDRFGAEWADLTRK